MFVEKYEYCSIHSGQTGFFNKKKKIILIYSMATLARHPKTHAIIDTNSSMWMNDT
jgi:hypothetical protein